MDQKINGGAAFPDPGRAQSAKQRENLTDTGMTLRDYFAARALAGLLSTCEREPGGATSSLNAADIACSSYKFADAMLAERAQ